MEAGRKLTALGRPPRPLTLPAQNTALELLPEASLLERRRTDVTEDLRTGTGGLDGCCGTICCSVFERADDENPEKYG